MCSNEKGSGPGPRAYTRNMLQPMPFSRKFKLVVSNTTVKIKTLSSCCGHHGEPGC